MFFGKHGPGSGSSLPPVLLIFAGLCTAVAVIVSGTSIFLHLKNYRKPYLQRMVIRIMVMVPLYAIASLISLFSLEAAFAIDVIRDIYEAFVIYCFFELLLQYLGGERALLILLHGRPPKTAVFPASLFRREIDVSDPYTFLFLKRGIIQYVQIKPVLAIVTLVLKAAGVYNEGDFRWDAGYLYVSVVYNFSICLALYCLAVFWMCVSHDLEPFRPMPKFLCVKGILFFSFWQSIAISLLVAVGVITKLGPYVDAEHISLGLTDTLICIEMPLFAIAHNYAFSFTDFVDPRATWVARMPILYALRDAFGCKDVIEDTKTTLKGEGMDYREFEPSEGYIHQGAGRERRIRAGLRYADGGRKKYWLPKTTADTDATSSLGGASGEWSVNRAVQRVTGAQEEDDVYAPLLEDDAEDVVHLAPDLRPPANPGVDDGPFIPGAIARSETGRDAYLLPFGDVDEADEALFDHARRYLFGDYNYPVIDCSSETARREMWDEEERILSDERGAYFSPLRSKPPPLPTHGRANGGYGATGTSTSQPRFDSNASAHKGKQAVIDREDDRIREVESGDLRLKWAKTPRHHAPSSASSRTHTPRPMSSRQSSGANRQSPPKTPSDDNKRPLPPDAVDLVVEDLDEEEKVMEEHRKGEPASREYRKVYRRGDIVEDEHGQTRDIEVEETRGGDSNWREDDRGNRWKEGDVHETPAEEVPIVQELEEPPPHTRLLDRLPSEDNPWA